MQIIAKTKASFTLHSEPIPAETNRVRLGKENQLHKTEAFTLRTETSRDEPNLNDPTLGLFS